MGSISEFSLDLEKSITPKTITDFVRKISSIEDGVVRLSKLEECVKSLEEERRKIDVFKRELPLCMFILNDVIEVVKEEAMKCRSANARPVLEEFLPIRSKFEEDGGAKREKDSRDKMNWMSSAQLWSDHSNNYNNNNKTNKKNKSVDVIEKGEEESERSAKENPFEGCKYKNGGGAFMPFKGFSGFSKEEKEVVVPLPLPDLSLLSPGIKISAVDSDGSGGSSSPDGSRAPPSSSSNVQSTVNQANPPRKARRCWSPELHRRFVNALQQLGGSQVATPKQIRELMKVDGLTNDEVKSHLQKYRLHTRRLPGSATASTSQQVVMLGGMWVPHDHYQTSKASTSQSGSPQGPLQLAAAGRGIFGTCGDSAEEEDGKSEGYSWKGHLQRSGEEETE
ncbi:myb family transcription factor EFM-like [Tasmannia lanceolata]|uniref:myb family transcription factor EFM-like n=1 Tax=Tasmannia lanceolata TaxID=3420 RepID=UPI0040642917